MKVGDRVKFLSEVGGGKIAGFQGKNIVLVEDKDGFQIPTPLSDVVVVQSEDYSTTKTISLSMENEEQKAEETPLSFGRRSVKAIMQQGQEEDVDMSVPDMVDVQKEIVFRPKVEERKGGNLLSLYLAFIPIDIKDLSHPRFETYLVNDSNYYIQFIYMSSEDNSWRLRSQREIEPNKKIYLEELSLTDVNHIGHIAVQLIAYKRDKPFTMKEPVCVSFRLEPIKFHKVHTFENNSFFDVPALLYTLIENDVPKRPWTVDPKILKQEMYRNLSSFHEEERVGEKHQQQLVNRYSAEQSKRNKKTGSFIHPHNYDDAIVIDLHANQLLDSTVGMSAGDILEYQMQVFRDTLKQYEHKKGQKLIFIHGKGEGVLRRSILNELTYKHKSYIYQDASFQEFGYGATQVTIK